MIVNCLFDTGSQRSLVKKNVLKGPYEAVSIEFLGSDSSKCRRVRRVKLWLISVKGNHHKKQMVEAVLAKLPSEDLMKKDTNLVSKTLGIVWDSANNELAYGVPPDVDLWSSDTKCQLISVTTKLYDPLGYLAPYVIRAKVLFQRLWQNGLNWDDETLSDLQKEWQTWKLELRDIPDI
ncbi:hypothetical protein T07_9119 [Trichinella nelsoni]|uniref:Peptidase aspartic putative domain-containing protein n=1 Tax=Trichinella nelsoni TaxID=6336 RepID=A0A0V0S122_9BILA|nr:hypothetical protein T07_9119 [Trichinella nelsoni]